MSSAYPEISLATLYGFAFNTSRLFSSGKAAAAVYLQEAKEFLTLHDIENKISSLKLRGYEDNTIPTNLTELTELERTTNPDYIQSLLTVPESATIGFDNITENSVMVFWNPHGDGGSAITGYHVVLKNEDTGQTIIELNPNPNTTNYFFQNLDSGTNYKVYLIVINVIGNSFEQSNGFKTLGVITPTYDFIIEPDGLVRMFRIGAVEYTEIKIQPESVQSIIDRNVGRLLTAQERAIPYPRPEPEPELKFCLNAYNIRESGSVYSTHYESITQQKVEELQQTQLVVACDANYLPTEKQVQDFYGFTPLPPAVDTSIDSTMISQLIGTFVLKDGKVKGQIMYIINDSFNQFYYGKNLASLVQIKNKSGYVIPIGNEPKGAFKINPLNFTQTERDEIIYIDEDVGNFKELTIDFFVWDSPVSMLKFSENKQIQVVVSPPDEPEPCEIGFHKDFSGKCVPDDPIGELPRDKLIDTLKGFLFGTVALSLLARKY